MTKHPGLLVWFIIAVGLALILGLAVGQKLAPDGAECQSQLQTAYRLYLSGDTRLASDLLLKAERTCGFYEVYEDFQNDHR